MEATLKVTSIEDGKIRQAVSELQVSVPAEDDPPVENEVINLYPDFTYQTITGFGGAMTEAAAHCLLRLPADLREKAIREYYGHGSSGYTLIRTHIDSCDFSLGMYQAVEDVTADPDLSGFSLRRDRETIIPAIREVMRISDRPISVLLSPWSPPAAWKTQPSRLKGIRTEDDFRKLFPPELAGGGTAQSNPVAFFMKQALETAVKTGQGIRTCGGHLKPEYYKSWAGYLVKYILEYLEEGIPVRFLSIQNEAQAATPWDSCEWTAGEEKTFLRDFLAPAMKAAGLERKVGIYFWDHNRENLVDRAMTVLDPDTEPLVAGAAFHWYSGEHYEAISLVHERYPSLHLMFSEGCCAYIPAGDPRQEAHAVQYAHDMISSLNAGMDSWFDWNLILDEKGGPNHVGNYCSAPMMLNGHGGYELRPSYYYIRGVTETAIPGAVRIGFSRYTDQLDVCAFRRPDQHIGCVILNRADHENKIHLRMNGKLCFFRVPARGIASLSLA